MGKPQTVEFQAKWTHDRTMKQLHPESGIESGRPFEMTPDRIERLLEEVIRNACRRGFSQFPQLQRWEMTGDVIQLATLSLLEALKSEKVSPESDEHLARVAQLHVQWTFLTLARQHRRSIRSKYATPVLRSDDGKRAEEREMAEMTPDSGRVDWVRFHFEAGKLPDDEREVFSRIWYRDMKKSDVASELNLNLRTVQRRYRRACERMMTVLDDSRF